VRRDILINTPARRYAHALLDVSIRHRSFSLVLEELESFHKQLQENALLQQVFLNPAVPPVKKKKVLENIAKKIGYQEVTVNFLNTLIHRNRLNLLEQVVISAEQQFLERQGIIVVEVTTAKKLDPEEEKKLTAQLESFTGKKVQLENRVSPSLIGGVVTKIGTTIYDGSVQMQLHHMKAKIVNEV
jgi:F-type H+-transporting ATPase subunit delta